VGFTVPVHLVADRPMIWMLCVRIGYCLSAECDQTWIGQLLQSVTQTCQHMSPKRVNHANQMSVAEHICRSNVLLPKHLVTLILESTSFMFNTSFSVV